MSSQYYSDYSYSTYTYTNRENSSQNEYSEKNHDSNKKQKQKPSSISLSDHLSSEIVEKNVLSINSYTDEEDNSDIKIDEDIVLISTRTENFEQKYEILMKDIKDLYRCVERHLFK